MHKQCEQCDSVIPTPRPQLNTHACAHTDSHTKQPSPAVTSGRVWKRAWALASPPAPMYLLRSTTALAHPTPDSWQNKPDSNPSSITITHTPQTQLFWRVFSKFISRDVLCSSSPGRLIVLATQEAVNQSASLLNPGLCLKDRNELFPWCTVESFYKVNTKNAGKKKKKLLGSYGFLFYSPLLTLVAEKIWLHFEGNKI